jgi:aspartyl-tRNA(Asn)/glutamyl-tRNA(Gln) amidotransferase subunit C
MRPDRAPAGRGAAASLKSPRMLDRSQVLHVARLARLELSEEEVERMGGELSKVLQHIEKIRELDLEGVAPTAHVVDAPSPLRADEPVRCLDRDVVLASAPEPVQGGFGVPSPGAAPA